MATLPSLSELRASEGWYVDAERLIDLVDDEESPPLEKMSTKEVRALLVNVGTLSQYHPSVSVCAAH